MSDYVSYLLVFCFPIIIFVSNSHSYMICCVLFNIEIYSYRNIDYNNCVILWLMLRPPHKRSQLPSGCAGDMEENN